MPLHLRFDGERVLAVAAHPDDAELLCAGTLARANRDGAAVGVCVLCRGDKGQPARPVANLAGARRREMIASAKLLGGELFLAGFDDGTLVDDRESRTKLVEIYRRFRPTLVLAHDPHDYHPDHRAASALAEAASWFAASRGHKTRTPAIDAPPAVWWMDTIQSQGFLPSFYVDVSEFADLKRDMLACHTSQIQRSGDRDFAPLADLMTRQMEARGAECGVAAAEAFRLHATMKRVRAF